MRVVILAGEASGDILGASLVAGLKAADPQVACSGITGPQMREQGCDTMADISELSVMGLAEVVKVLPRILKLRRRIIREILALRPDVVVGVDAPDFNLPIERRLRKAGIRVVHMVSPTIWAWRPRRRFGIAKSCDAVLCLYPFEPECYADTSVRAEFIGHPLADALDDGVSTQEARQTLGVEIPADAPVIGLLPGSRAAEVLRIMPRFVAAAALLADRHPDLRVLVPVAHDGLRALMERLTQDAPRVRWTLVEGQSRNVMRAADALLLGSGTVTLEALLLGRPMVVSYVASALSVWIMRSFRLLKTNHIALPNILAQQAVVPELLQEQATPERLAAAIDNLLSDAAARESQLARFAAVRERLAQGANQRAAAVITDIAAGR